MDVDNATSFLAGAILYSVGWLIILIAVVVSNNIIAKFWKSWGWKLMPQWMNELHPRFASQEEMEKIAPQFEDLKSNPNTKQSVG